MANAEPAREEDEPEASDRRIRIDVVPRKAPKRSKMSARTTITALMRSSRTKRRRPHFMENAATSQ